MGLAEGKLRVATLHPLLGIMVREIGGDLVEVVDLSGPGGDPHHFEPSAEDLRRAGRADVFLASGMGLEPYLPRLRDIVPSGVAIVEMDQGLPALPMVERDDDDHGTQDPHWWHSIDRYRRATGLVCETLSKLDPASAAVIRKQTLAYRQRLDALENWTRREIARIPKERRVLATTHAAFQYFCRDWGFRMIALQGVNHEQMPDPATVAKLLGIIRQQRVPAIFPEKEANGAILEVIARDSGVPLAGPLCADGTGVTSYEGMIRGNVQSLTAALADARPASTH